jgi:hypothetical protein
LRRLHYSSALRIQVSILGLLLLALGAVTTADRAAATVEVTTVRIAPKDTYLRNDKKNYNTSTTLSTYTWPDYKISNAILMKFDLSSLPPGATVTSATLHLALVASDPKSDPTYAVTAHKVISKNPNVLKATGYTADGVTAWSASTCCQGAPLAQADISPAQDIQLINKTNGFKTWTITTMVQEWLANPSSNMGVLLDSDATKLRDRYRTFASMENSNVSLRPYLEITFVAVDVTPPVVSITAPAAGDVSGLVPLTANASDNVAVASVQFNVNGTPVSPALLAFPSTFNWDSTTRSDGTYSLTAVARDVAGNATTSAPIIVAVKNGVVWLSPQDTTLMINANNYSADPSLMTYTWPDNAPANAIVMKFDLGSLPAGSIVSDATLMLALVQSDLLPELTYNVSANKVINLNPVIAQANGYNADAATPWTPSACCSGGVPLAQSDISPAYATVAVDKLPGFKSWNLTGMVQEWVTDPSTNFGVLLNSDASKTRDHYRYFGSVDNSDPNLRPVLRLTYSVSTDTTPPVIAAVTASGVTASGAIINWTTDEPADSQVEFGLTTAYGSASPLDSAKITGHTVTLSGLTGATQYHFRVRSRDQSANAADSVDFTFTTLDGVAPSVSLTAPANGAGVAATINVSANASDNVGVAGVQFMLDGSSLATEDTSSPFSTSWDTTAVSDGSHTLAAVARDAAGNVTTSAAITVSVSNAPPPPPPPPAGGIAGLYPGDVGIENDPNVVFVERFDEATLANLFGRWTDVLNGPGMSIMNDAPANSPVGKSLVISFSGTSTGGHLYRQLTQPVSDTLYVRYYIKHPALNNYQHSGVWMGGYNPSLAWPNPQAGVKPTGSDRFSASAEQNDNNFDHYDYWMGMHQSNDGNYWGDHLLNNPNVQAPGDQWMCVEQMVKLNTPVTASNGEHAIWINGVKVSHLGQGFPNGSWSGGIFTQDPSGVPFEGFQWRNTTNLNLNWLWLQVYSTSGAGTFKYAHVVAAKSYIGCLAPGGGVPDTTLPAVALSAPAAGATVTGTVNVTANASDNVGVAGVQFKLDGANLGAEDTTAPYSVSWNTTSASNASHTLTAVVRDAAGNSSTSAPSSVTVSNAAPPPSALWPHEPSGFVTIEETGWESGTLGNWYRIHQSLDKPINVGPITNSIIGESQTLQLDYPAGHTGGGGTELRYDIAAADRRNEIYVAYYVQVNPQWQGHSSAINKMVYLHDGGSQFAAMWYEMFGSGSNPLGLYVVNQSGSGPAGIHESPGTVNFTRGQWHLVEIYQKQGASLNGIVRVWVDGVLAIDRSDVGTRSNPLDNITISGIWGGVGDTKLQADYMRFDRIRISRPVQ